MEQILDFNTPLNLQLLDQILEQQQKYNDLLNKFVHHELASTKIDELLKSNSERIKFFGLTVIDTNIIKGNKLNQFKIEQKSSIITELLNISFQSNESASISIKKKSASLIAIILVKEWINGNQSEDSFKLFENYMSQLIKVIQEPKELNQLYSVILVFSNFAYCIKQEDTLANLKSGQQVFDMVFTKSFELFDFIEKNKQSIMVNQKQLYEEIIKEILKAISSLFDFVSLDYCFRTDLVLFLITRMNESDSKLYSPFVLCLSEHINVLVSKVIMLELSGATSSSNQEKLNQMVSTIFRSLVTACSKSIPNDMKIRSSTMLFENISTLFTTYLKNFLLVLEKIDTESLLYCEKYLITMIQHLPMDRLTIVLEYLSQLYKGFLTSGDNQKARLSLHSQLMPLYFSNILIILEKHDEEQSEDNELKGILFNTNIDKDQAINNNNNNINSNEEGEEETWKKIELLLSESLESIGSICFNDVFDSFTKKLVTTLSSNQNEKYKMNSIFWSLGYICKFSTQFDTINAFISKLIDPNSLSTLKQDKRFSMISGLLFFIGHSNKYLEFQNNSQYIKSIIEIIVQQLLPSASNPLVQISMITLNAIIEIRKQFISFDLPELHIILNQFVINNSNNTNITTNQFEMIYRCIGSFIFNFNQFNSNQFNQQSLQQILNPLIDALKSMNNYQDKFTQWSNAINNSLCYNIALAKSMKHLFNVQMPQLYPILLDLFKWSNQEHQPIDKYLGTQISLKKNIIKLLTCYIYNQNINSNDTNTQQSLQNSMLSFLELLCQDPTRSSQIYIVDVLPRTLSFISCVISTFKTNLLPQISKGLFDTFYKFSLEQAFNQSKSSKGLILLSKIWNLIDSIQTFNSSLLTSDINLVYFELINKCLENISPSVNGSALESLYNYFTKIVSTPQIFDFNILFREYVLILNLFYNSEYQTSLEKITKLLFIMIQLTNNNNNSKNQLMSLLEQKYKSISNNNTNEITLKIQQLFNINNLESFENNIKLIYK